MMGSNAFEILRVLDGGSRVDNEDGINVRSATPILLKSMLGLDLPGVTNTPDPVLFGPPEPEAVALFWFSGVISLLGFFGF